MQGLGKTDSMVDLELIRFPVGRLPAKDRMASTHMPTFFKMMAILISGRMRAA